MIIFTDTNKELINEVKKINFSNSNLHTEVIIEDKDVLEVKKQYPDALIVTASNPEFKAGGGLDAVLSKEYSEQWKEAQEFKFTKDLFFVVSCDNNIKSSRAIIKRALLGVYFASRKHNIILTGIGTSIAGLSINEFIEELKLFSNADFSFANFRTANFIDANFSSANFSDADFSNANFRNVDFSNTNFKTANFRYANFINADFINAYFSSANFRTTNFSSTNFSDADFRIANFRTTNFNNADLSNANFSNVIFNQRILPDEGSIIGWKKAQLKIIKLKVIDCKNAVGGLVGRKCRTKSVEVLEFQELDGTIITDITELSSDYNNKFKYKIGEIITVEDWNDKPYLECEKGIHFFITRDEAVRY